jgi:hypothetical protein
MIPKVFELSSIFIPQDKNKYYYELIGAVCLTASKNYTSFYKINNSQWTHYDDEKINNFANYFDIISNSLKYQELPLLIFYQINDKLNERDKDYSAEDIGKLERYCRNIDNLNLIIQNKFRPSEDIIKYTEEDDDNMNKLRRHDKGDNKSNTNSRQNSNNYYECFFCGAKNKIDDKNSNTCVKCNKSNEKLVEDMKRKADKKMNRNNSVKNEEVVNDQSKLNYINGDYDDVKKVKNEKNGNLLLIINRL